MADWSDTNPDITTQYDQVLQQLRERDKDALTLGNSTTQTNLPTNAVRWNATASKFEKWDGAAWQDLAAKYAINVDKVDGYDVGNASGNIPLSNGALNANLNADKLDGYNASTGTTANTIPVRDSSGKLPGSITGDAATVGGLAASTFMRVNAVADLNMNTRRIQFANATGDKIRLYSTTYGLAINPSELTLYHPSSATLRVRSGPSGSILGTVWHSGNDGAGSGLDADKLRGLSINDPPDSTNYSTSTKTWIRVTERYSKILSVSFGGRGDYITSAGLTANSDAILQIPIATNHRALEILFYTYLVDSTSRYNNSNVAAYQQDSGGNELTELFRYYVGGSTSFSFNDRVVLTRADPSDSTIFVKVSAYATPANFGAYCIGVYR